MTTTEWISISVAFLALLAAVATVLMSRLQLKDAKRTTRVQNLMNLLHFLYDRDLSEHRKTVRTGLGEKMLAEWTDEEMQAARSVCSSYDFAGLLVRGGLVPEDLFLESWGPSIRDLYEILAPYLQSAQSSGLSGQDYWSSYTWLYTRATDRSL
jgi:hypothetical protein